ncbi:hypothetical protein MOP93_09215 [Escherichia coli]|uniref:hypothetical protein n=1 Tax=Escherichia coli TaxID=562 RepID=UPI00214915C2|nr:hypothetical protein [Escherichia coli]MCR1051283.1 hypothetical protein [Escherichia coli]
MARITARGDGPGGKPNTAGGPRTSTMQVNQYNIGNEQDAAQKFGSGHDSSVE